MSEPTMSMFANKEDCLRARAEYFQQQRDELIEALKVAKEVLDDHDYPLANYASLVVDAAISKVEAQS